MITVSEDTLTKMNVPVTTIANRAMDRAFSEIAAGFEEIGLPVTGDIAPEEIVHTEDQFVEYVCMMAVNNPTLARLDGARTPDLALAEQHFERCARALREAITAWAAPPTEPGLPGVGSATTWSSQVHLAREAFDHAWERLSQERMKAAMRRC